MSSNFERLMQNNPFEKSFFPNSLPKGITSPSDWGELFLQLPHSDLHGWIYPGDFYKNCEVFRGQLSRLRQIGCLSYLAHIENGVKIEDQYLQRPNHTRENHTFIVAATGAMILEQNKVNKLETKKYISAAFLHDMATPALGDATKYLDVESLHEELHWKKMLTATSREYLNNIPASLEEINAIIKNEGLLGQVLDIADRITYVCQDLHNLARQPNKHESKNNIKYSLLKFNLYYPNIGDIYKDVKIENNEVYFANPERLLQFLRLRVLLFKNVYMHPVNQGRDYNVASKIKPFYKSNNNTSGLLTPDDLRQMDDYDLIGYLAQQNNQSKMDFEMELDRWYPQFYEKFKSLELAEARKSNLEKYSKIKIIGIKESVGCSASTKYKVKNKDGQLVTLHEYNPQGAAVIEKMAAKVKGFCLYYERIDSNRQNLD